MLLIRRQVPSFFPSTGWLSLALDLCIRAYRRNLGALGRLSALSLFLLFVFFVTSLSP